MKYTLEKLAGMSPKERRLALNNNKKNLANPKFADAAIFNINLIEESGYSLGPEKELADGDWQLREIEKVVNDPANETAMLEAVQRNEPPLGAIEHLIVTKLGAEYKGAERRDTVHAGDLVAKRMYALGFEKITAGEKKMPDGSVARKAATFRKKKGKT